MGLHCGEIVDTALKSGWEIDRTTKWCIIDKRGWGQPREILRLLMQQLLLLVLIWQGGGRGSWRWHILAGKLNWQRRTRLNVIFYGCLCVLYFNVWSSIFIFRSTLVFCKPVYSLENDVTCRNKSWCLVYFFKPQYGCLVQQMNSSDRSPKISLSCYFSWSLSNGIPHWIMHWHIL